MTLRLNGDSSGFTEIKAADAAGDNSIKLPASNGSANQLLQNGGTAGELQYTSAGGGLHYDSSGRLLAGTSTARTHFYGTLDSHVQIEGAGASADASRFTSLVFGSSSTADPLLNFAKHRSNSVGGTDIVQDGDLLGGIAFHGADGSKFHNGAEIRGAVDGTPGNDVMPGKIIFSTNPGNTSTTPRIEIGSNGTLKLLAGCPGIDFSGIQTNTAGMTSETLDSYEEGTFSPTLTTINSSGSLSWNNTNGYYVKVGNVCTATFYSSTMTISNNGSAHALITGLPFTAYNSSNHYPVVHFTHVNAFQNNVVSGFVSTNTGNIYPLAYGQITQVNWTTGTPLYLMFSVTYRTN